MDVFESPKAGGAMPDDQIVKLLEEIRDLQKENVANQKLALQNQQVAMQNQQQSMAVQKRAVTRSKVVFVLVACFFLFLGLSYVVPLLFWFLSWLHHR
jgi:hypothetical protein